MALPRWRQALLTALAASLLATAARGASAPVDVSVTLLSKNICKFDTANSTLAFGNLYGGASADAFATATIGVRCVGADPVATFAVSDDGGLHETGPGAYRMVHGTDPAAFLPYELAYVPSTATIPKMVWQTITLTGRILASDISLAVPGSYADTVVLTLLP